jgi:transposase
VDTPHQPNPVHLEMGGDERIGVRINDRPAKPVSHLWDGQHQYGRAHLRRDFQTMIDRNNDGSETGRELLSLSDEL